MFEVLAYWFSISVLTGLYLLPVVTGGGSITKAWLKRILGRSILPAQKQCEIVYKFERVYTKPVRILRDIGSEPLVVIVFTLTAIWWSMNTLVFFRNMSLGLADTPYFECVITQFHNTASVVAPYISYIVPFIIIGVWAEYVIPKAINVFIKVQRSIEQLTGDK